MRYTLFVGTQNWSSWSLRPWLALKATGAAFETVVVQLYVPGSVEKILRHSPSGKVPALKVEDGAKSYTVWDSLAICETLAERHPEAGLWPEDSVARATARSLSTEMHSGFRELRAELAMEFACRLPTPDLSEAARVQIARIVAAWEAAFGKHGQDFLFGRFSIADCMYAPVVSRFVTYGIALPPRAEAYAARIMALPAMQEWGAGAKKEVDAGLGLFRKS